LNDAALCRKNRWVVGTRLRGVEGSGDWWCATTIEITAIGERSVLAKAVGQIDSSGKVDRNDLGHENSWTLQHRNWRKVRQEEA